MITEVILEGSFGRRVIPVVGQSADIIADHVYFKRWLDTFDHERMIVELIAIQSADIISQRVIFVKFEARVRDAKTGKILPGIVFMRGDSIAMLTRVRNRQTGQISVLIIRQPRMPVGGYDFEEIPAGMLDKNDGPVGRAVVEMEEETGLTITREDLLELGTFVPSTGGCDEHVVCFDLKLELDDQKIREIIADQHGCPEEGEQISVGYYPYRSLSMVSVPVRLKMAKL